MLSNLERFYPPVIERIVSMLENEQSLYIARLVDYDVES
jgi:hypothetical protein